MGTQEYGGWEKIRPLGEGGQGEVFLVRSPQRAKARNEARITISGCIGGVNPGVPGSALRAADELARGIAEFNRPENPNELGALKQFKVPDESDKRDKVLQRFHNELNALQQIEGEPAALRVLASGPYEYWMITEYHPAGSLSRYPEMFRGNARGALEALCPIIALVAKLHEKGIVHRDIKLGNVLIDRSGRLVLSDFGIVFREADQRPTELVERVGSRDWMAPWGHIGMRVDDVKENFDVFPLGKVLWCMISGRPMLPFWYFDKPQFDLTRMFPGDPSMHAINAILANCIVQEEEACWTSARDLLVAVDSTLEMLAHGGQALTDGVPRPCRVCGVGDYRPEQRFAMLSEHHPPLKARIYSCWKCGHVQLFVPPLAGAR